MFGIKIRWIKWHNCLKWQKNGDLMLNKNDC
jgi:hypothetical protein